MEQEKQIQLRRGGAVLTRRNGKDVSSRPTGRINTAVVLDLLKKYPDRFHTLSHIAIAVFGGDGKMKRDYVHQKLSGLCKKLQDVDVLCYLTYEDEAPHRTNGLKLYQGSEEDAKRFKVYLDRAKARKEITQKRYEKLVNQAETFQSVVAMPTQEG